MKRHSALILVGAGAAALAAGAFAQERSGKAAFGDYKSDAPAPTRINAECRFICLLLACCRPPVPWRCRFAM